MNLKLALVLVVFGMVAMTTIDAFSKYTEGNQVSTEKKIFSGHLLYRYECTQEMIY